MTRAASASTKKKGFASERSSDRTASMIARRGVCGRTRMPAVALTKMGKRCQSALYRRSSTLACSMSGSSVAAAASGSSGSDEIPGARRFVQSSEVSGCEMGGGSVEKTRLGHSYTCSREPVEPASMSRPKSAPCDTGRGPNAMSGCTPGSAVRSTLGAGEGGGEGGGGGRGERAAGVSLFFAAAPSGARRRRAHTARLIFGPMKILYCTLKARAGAHVSKCSI